MTITFPNEYAVGIIDNIRAVIGRDIIIEESAQIVCSSCSYDSINQSSTDPFCPVCSGLYYLPIYTETTVSGHVAWGHTESFNWVVGGQMGEGDCRVQIKYTEEIKNHIENASYLRVDGIKLRILKKIYRGVQNINRILLDLERV